MDRGEACWLDALAAWDREQGWALDGQLSAADWLMWRAKMSRATAYEKLRIAHELLVRPVIAAAFLAGRLSYSAVRVITRIADPDPEVDAALVDLAEAGSVADVERAVRFYQRHADQHRPLPVPPPARDVRIVRHGDGTGKIEIALDAVEIEEVAVALQAFLDLRAERREGSESPGGDGAGGSAGDAPGDPAEAGDRGRWGRESLRGDSEECAGGRGEPSWPDRRADAFVEMTRTALAHANDGHAMGADRYLVHLVARDGVVRLLDGSEVDVAAAGTVACDASMVVHLDEPLALGRKTRVWSTAQRRAILVRDRGTCRFPGCGHRVVDIHHQTGWDSGGSTDVTNGLLLCNGHHRFQHRGFTSTGDTNATVTFYRPDGTPLGQSDPPEHTDAVRRLVTLS
jgi:hypothetical protein